MRVMAQRDFASAGYPILAFAGILVTGGLINRVAKQLVSVEEAFGSSPRQRSKAGGKLRAAERLRQPRQIGIDAVPLGIA